MISSAEEKGREGFSGGKGCLRGVCGAEWDIQEILL